MEIGRTQQFADCPDLVAAAVRLTLDASRCGPRLSGELMRTPLRTQGEAMARHSICELARVAPQRLLRMPSGSGLPAALARAAAAEGSASAELQECLHVVHLLLRGCLVEQADRPQAVAAALEVVQVPGFMHAVVWGLGDNDACKFAACALIAVLTSTDPCVCGTAGLPAIDRVLATPGLLTALLTAIGGPGVSACSSSNRCSRSGLSGGSGSSRSSAGSSSQGGGSSGGASGSGGGGNGGKSGGGRRGGGACGSSGLDRRRSSGRGAGSSQEEAPGWSYPGSRCH